MQFKATFLLIGILAAGSALAHGGVKNPEVMARMNLMGEIKESIGVLGKMAKGATRFDVDRAEAAKGALINAATRIPVAFENPAKDPKSEALPTIWEDWEDFSAQAAGMAESVASVDVSSLAGVQTGMKVIGQSCSGCHKDYRIDK
ncbi:cytochrome c [Thalassovita sp.]|uniref:c-type cytochrome n=1 Tax=Thalassovita sp. TaxID=1979401 RepID=UPI0029DE5387|nr:cytochrome c [Thalassovita sp.]